MDYEAMLNAGQSALPESVTNRERFEVPNVQGHIEGTKTVLSNITAIAQHIRRDPEHFTKFLLRELATPGTLRSNEVILGRKISSVSINEKIKKYVNQFVICSECTRPDTDLVRDKKVTFIVCKACGAKKPVHDFM